MEEGAARCGLKLDGRPKPRSALYSPSFCVTSARVTALKTPIIMFLTIAFRMTWLARPSPEPVFSRMRALASLALAIAFAVEHERSGGYCTGIPIARKRGTLLIVEGLTTSS